VIIQAEPNPIVSAAVIAAAFVALLITIAMRARLFLLRRKTRKLKARLNKMRQVWEENERRTKAAGIELGKGS